MGTVRLRLKCNNSPCLLCGGRACPFSYRIVDRRFSREKQRKGDRLPAHQGPVDGQWQRGAHHPAGMGRGQLDEPGGAT